MSVTTIVTDIEGTTSSIAFVHDVLFPYAQKALPDFVRKKAGDDEIEKQLDAAREEAGEPDADVDRVIGILCRWIDEDRKATPLKALQGMVWRHGYENGDFTGHVYDDAAERMRSWAGQGIGLYVYSSGSVEAQQLLFGHSDAGDLRPLFRGWFDTRIGHKRDVDAYAAIAASVGEPASSILFLSDVVEELDAARSAGMSTTQLVRGDDVVTGDHPVAACFDEVVLD